MAPTCPRTPARHRHLKPLGAPRERVEPAVLGVAARGGYTVCTSTRAYLEHASHCVRMCLCVSACVVCCVPA